MFQKIIQFLFRKPILFILNRISSSPKSKNVFGKLSNLYNAILQNNTKTGLQLEITNESKIVIISDLHKGSGNNADDFRNSETNYLAACYYYLQNDFTYIALGDIEELWENKIEAIVAQYENTIVAEKEFVQKNKFYKVFGNHDLYWKTAGNNAKKWLQKMYNKNLNIYEAILLQYKSKQNPLHILLTHGHQGDGASDGNKYSQWFVAHIWAPFQAYLDINPNTPSKDFILRNKHNKLMYEWSVLQKNTILITGHTHKPVFASKNHLEQLQLELIIAKQKNNLNEIKILEKKISEKSADYVILEPYLQKKPSYFNSGCGCFNDGDITLIEIENGSIKLVKWCLLNGEPIRKEGEKLFQKLTAIQDEINTIN